MYNIVKNVFMVGGWILAMIVMFTLACGWISAANTFLVFLGVGVLLIDIVLLILGGRYFLNKINSMLEDQNNE